MTKSMNVVHALDASSPLFAWLNHFGQLHTKVIDLGLERAAEVATRAALLKPAPFIFTVAGTNGKGTTCRMLEAVLIASGLRVGVYSSPHLLHYTERVRIQGEALTEQQHSASFAQIETARGTVSLTYFEAGTLAALNLFKQANLDIVILEVGLGGRLDATNIVDSDVAVVTSIGLDHTDRLGPDRNSIGREKAGIFRTDKAAVVGERDMPTSIAEVAAKKGAHLLQCGLDWRWEASAHDWRFTDAQGELRQLPLPLIPLANAATALAALRAANFTIDEQALRRCLAQTTLPGRFQILQHTPLTIVDVAHNPPAAAWLAQRLVQQTPTGRRHAVVGMLADKDIAGTLSSLNEHIDMWYCASLDTPRGANAAQLAAYLPQADCYSCVVDAWHAALASAAPNDTIVIFGSFYTVAQMLQLWATGINRGK